MQLFPEYFCDVERFTDDQQEIMAQRGMGVLYTSLDNGRPLRKVEEKERKEILYRYYFFHHQALEAAVQKQLQELGKALIVDGHSFPDLPLKRDLDQRPNRPDFNIGTDPFHTPASLIEYSITYFREQGYSIGVDWPYSGALVPAKYYRQNKAVHSIMLEVNRSRYLEEGKAEKSKNYPQIKEVVSRFLHGLKQLDLGT